MASKEVEYRFLNGFLDSRPDLKFEEISASESPDFLARCEGKSVGVEVTQYLEIPKPGSPHPQEQASLRRRIADDTRRLYESNGGHPLHAQFFFSYFHPLSMRRLPTLIEDVASLLLMHSRALEVYESKEISAVTEDDVPDEIGQISIRRVPSRDYGVWSPSVAGWLHSIGCSNIETFIGSKENKVVDYRRKCEIIWLIIVFDFVPDGNQTLMGPPSEPVTFFIETQFDAVFCFDCFSQRSVSIPIGQPNSVFL